MPKGVAHVYCGKPSCVRRIETLPDKHKITPFRRPHAGRGLNFEPVFHPILSPVALMGRGLKPPEYKEQPGDLSRPSCGRD